MLTKLADIRKELGSLLEWLKAATLALRFVCDPSFRHEVGVKPFNRFCGWLRTAFEPIGAGWACPLVRDARKSADTAPPPEWVEELEKQLTKKGLDAGVVCDIGRCWEEDRGLFENEVISNLPPTFKKKLLGDSDEIRQAWAIWFRPHDESALTALSKKHQAEIDAAGGWQCYEWATFHWDHVASLLRNPSWEVRWPDIDPAIKKAEQVCAAFEREGRLSFTPTVEVAATPAGDAFGLHRACQATLDVLVKARAHKKAQPDAQVNDRGEMTYQTLVERVEACGVALEAFDLSLAILVAHGLARVVPTGPNQDVHLVSAADAARRHRGVPFDVCPEPTIQRIEEVILAYFEATEETVHARVDRIPDDKSRALAGFLLKVKACNWPSAGAPEEAVRKYIRFVFPSVTMDAVPPAPACKQPHRFQIALGAATPAWLMEAISEVHQVAGDEVRHCAVREYFGQCPFPAKGEYAASLEDLISKRRVRVSEFRPISDNDEAPWPYGPIFRLRLSRDANAELRTNGSLSHLENSRPSVGLPPEGLLTDGEKAVWDALHGKVMTGKELAKLLGSAPQSVKEHVKAIRRKGYSIRNQRGRGYFRPDAPPSDIRRT